jgi:succinate dehydrogenase / fumarate reductase membrane anchor subunit
MSSLETPRHRVEGLGAAHTGVQQFWRLRVSGAALGLLSFWFAYVALGLVGANQPTVLAFFQRPLNAILGAAFMALASYHMTLGLREVVEDYIHTSGAKLFLLLLIRVFGFAVAITALLALYRIVTP